MKFLATLLLSLMVSTIALADVTYTEGAWTLQSSVGNQAASSLADCETRWKALPPPVKSRTDYCRLSLSTKVTATPPVPPPTGSSAYFTDLTSAPAGSPLLVCGKSVPSVAIGGTEQTIIVHQSAVAYDCARLIPTASGSITVNGAATGLTFTRSTGRVLYVSISGSDATARVNDPLRPWRYVQTSASERSGALSTAAPGDVVVMRGGDWRDVGFQSRAVRFLTIKNISIVSYPGETVNWLVGKGGGINGPDSVHAGQASGITISSLKIVGSPQAASDGCPINLQYGADSWRVVNNDLSWPVAPPGMKCAGVAGHGANVSILGNNIHDIAGGQENHGIYIDGGDGRNGPYEIAYNAVTRVVSGNLIQTFDNYNDAIKGFNIHDNTLTNGGRYGLNLSDGTVSGTVTNNSIVNTALSGIRMNFISSSATDITIRLNTLTNVNTVGAPSSQGAINCDSTVKQGKVVINTNKITRGAGAKEDYSEYGECPAVRYVP